MDGRPQRQGPGSATRLAHAGTQGRSADREVLVKVGPPLEPAGAASDSADGVEVATPSALTATVTGAHVRASGGDGERAGGGLPVERPTFHEVYERYFDLVWRSAANRGIPRRALDDVTQEVFIVINRKLPEFEGRSSVRTWVAGIVRRVVADYVRKRGNQPAGDETLEREPAGSVPASEALERKDAIELLDALLAKMTNDQREVFVLHELEELSGVEIAELTGTNENTVWTRLRAARRIFQEGVTRGRARHTREEA